MLLNVRKSWLTDLLQATKKPQPTVKNATLNVGEMQIPICVCWWFTPGLTRSPELNVRNVTLNVGVTNVCFSFKGSRITHLSLQNSSPKCDNCDFECVTNLNINVRFQHGPQ